MKKGKVDDDPSMNNVIRFVLSLFDKPALLVVPTPVPLRPDDEPPKITRALEASHTGDPLIRSVDTYKFYLT